MTVRAYKGIVRPLRSLLGPCRHEKLGSPNVAPGTPVYHTCPTCGVACVWRLAERDWVALENRDPLRGDHTEMKPLTPMVKK